MNLLKVRIVIGLFVPLRVLHVSDTHLTLADGRDDPRKQALAARRSALFGKEECLRNFSEVVAYAWNSCDLMICSGGLIDFVPEKNLDTAKEMLSGTDYVFAADEFSKYVGETVEDEAYMLDSLPLVQRYQEQPAFRIAPDRRGQSCGGGQFLLPVPPGRTGGVPA